METLSPYAAPLTILLLLAWLVLRLRSARRAQAPIQQEELDTVADWPPEAARVLSITERQALELLKRAMPGYLVLGQVPLSRFLRVPARHSYSMWLQRVGSLSADLLICDGGSRVLAVIDIRTTQESARSRRRHERMARVLRAARIRVHEWREGELPSVAEVRQAMAHVLQPASPGIASQPGSSRPMPLIPLPDIQEVLSAGDRAAAEAAFDQALEPVPSGFYEDNEPAPQR
ncbi:MAG: DUF2726 domain-containing protein [Betaproteobacteria bacterium]